ncbi:MAG TPA: glycoside hydrolase family 32 protein [Candidatus Anaerostipes excrementavium]|uniref:Sucrose-6-phosphate hydrolase n=1 Tax=Candidatus Anaerostipes excrementavium TaxID=2838463 RepID=A0A9D1WWY2_9FIRM|nr:glycoside hydrolase family 32 protein [uncultured Anaerostipes sp.]HIX68688.1 glycoside hydrolase family 32 protein [Candidatus Anaerostipes excrementavium]
MRSRKQQYHLEPPRGLVNDPNGLAYFNGRYYVFFQWNRFAKNHKYKEWGLFTSKDLLHWNFEGSALLPDQSYDQYGVYSGSSYVINDRLYLFYTGNAKKNGQRKSSQCIAITNDGQRFLKLGCAVKTPEDYTEHFRDPKVFQLNHKDYFMLIGAQKQDGNSGIALCRSDNGLSWNYIGLYAQSQKFNMIECPDLFRLAHSYILLFSPQIWNHQKNRCEFSFSAYKIVSFDGTISEDHLEDLDNGYLPMDYGFDFYAPQTFTNTKGQRILFAWMSRMEEEEEKAFSKGSPRIHCLTLPRKLSLKNGKLCQMPADELYSMRGQRIPIYESSSSFFLQPKCRQFYLRFCSSQELDSFSISFYGKEASLVYDQKRRIICLTRKNWLSGQKENRECTPTSLNDIEIWSDSSSLEIFLNKGEYVMSSRIYPESSDLRIRVSGNIKKSEIEIYELNHMEGEIYE